MSEKPESGRNDPPGKESGSFDFRPAKDDETIPLDSALNRQNYGGEALIGQIVAGHYEILEVIGEGGMSVVYRARHQHLNRQVAIKFLHAHLVSSRNNLERFKQEARSVSQLEHRGVVRVYDFGLSKSGRPYIVMDLLKGRSLSQLIKDTIAETGAALAPSRALPIFIQIAEALAYTHNKGIVHRDLKPSNIIILDKAPGDTKEDEIRILDFGIAKLLPHAGTDGAALTQTGEVFGSPLYMSPEQCKGEKLDSRSDIYSMGCLMYETLTGKTPISGANMLEILYRHMNEMPKPMKGQVANLSGQLESLVFKTLAKDPRDRYQNMEALVSALKDCINQEQSFLRQVLSGFSLYRSRRKRLQPAEQFAIVAGILALAATVLSAGTALALYLYGNSGLALDTMPDWKLSIEDSARTSPEDMLQKLSRSRLTSTLKHRLENLQKLAKEGKLDEMTADSNTEVQNAIRIARRLMHSGQSKDASELADYAYRISQIENGGKSMLTVETAVIYTQALYNAKEYTKALDSLKELFTTYLQITTKVGQHPTAVLCTLAGDCYFNLKDIPHARMALSDARRFYELGDAQNEHTEGWEEEMSAFAYSRSGDVAAIEKNYREAAGYYQEAEKRWTRVTTAHVAYNRALILYKESVSLAKSGQLERAENKANQLINYLNENKNNELVAKNRFNFLGNYANTLREQGDWLASAGRSIQIGLARLKDN